MSKIYNNAGDLLVCAFKMMNDGKTKKALECAELALKLPSMRVIASGLEQMNRVHAEEDEDDVVVDEELNEDEIEESSDEEPEEDIDIDVEEEVEDDSEEASDDEEPEEEIEEDVDEEVEESSDDEPEEEEIDEEELDEVLSSLRKQYNVKSSIVTAAKRKGARKKAKACGCGCKKVKACGTKPANSGSALPLSTMAKLRGLVNKSAMKAKK